MLRHARLRPGRAHDCRPSAGAQGKSKPAAARRERTTTSLRPARSTLDRPQNSAGVPAWACAPCSRSRELGWRSQDTHQYIHFRHVWHGGRYWGSDDACSAPFIAAPPAGRVYFAQRGCMYVHSARMRMRT
ncbi:hypothetical protein PYCCODRAFT_51783 [Trametes coccinea BRFM310]|uniref:Uncharacterized protein n=1 Tax=Trametes coccinea (strain BRFM310) TaxID=1353009 RepID=A0A1Y2J777_TRAC3|nr:hypothetical protein PYCCODRAFT_51783 [Trametes coccinea BRFM310]